MNTATTTVTTAMTPAADIQNNLKTNKKETAVLDRRNFIKKLMENGSERIKTVCEEVEELFNKVDLAPLLKK